MHLSEGIEDAQISQDALPNTAAKPITPDLEDTVRAAERMPVTQEQQDAAITEPST